MAKLFTWTGAASQRPEKLRILSTTSIPTHRAHQTGAKTTLRVENRLYWIPWLMTKSPLVPDAISWRKGLAGTV
jgi:hypothetical protein